jgi:hypothetical protein
MSWPMRPSAGLEIHWEKGTAKVALDSKKLDLSNNCQGSYGHHSTSKKLRRALRQYRYIYERVWP